MDRDVIVLKQSPIQFLKWLAIVILLFALVPVGLIFVPPLRDTYETTAIARSLSYNLLLTIAWAIIQTGILAGMFIAWYLPTYLVDSAQIRFRRGQRGAEKRLAQTQLITDIEVEQGFLARRFGYGSLVVFTDKNSAPIKIANIADPDVVAEHIQDMVEAEPVTAPLPAPKPAEELIDDGESQFVEFKASLMWDYRQQRANKALYDPVMKNVAGFMNSSGGTLLIGVDDEGEVLGLEPDYSVMKKGDSDGFANVFNMAFSSMIGVENRHFLQMTFPKLNGKEICVVTVHPSDRPVYLTSKGNEKFYIRAGNGSQALSVSKAMTYMQSRFDLT